MTPAARAPSAVVVDDSRFMRGVISDMLEDGGIPVVDAAENGRQAVAAVAEHDPDVVTMDLEMPEMDGVAAVERIMADHPVPILVLSAHASAGNGRTFDALDRGAVDFFTKPGGEVSAAMSRHETELLEKVRSVAGADVDSLAAGTEPGTPVDRGGHRGEFVADPTLLIGASTGGPSVVERILSELPLAADLRILIVQHMPDEFTGRFADRLDGASQYAVHEATDGARIGGGEALVARGGYHMKVTAYRGGRLRVKLTETAPEHNVRPAVDVTMRSAARQIDDPVTAAILTGMGEDGAAGVRAVSDAGGAVVAQDESTSAVYGMPKRAVETGAVDASAGVDRLTEAILETLHED